MEWNDDGLVLGVRAHGEGHAIAVLLTAAHGLRSGLVYGGASRRMAPVLQPGNGVRAVWRARLEDQLGRFSIEPVLDRAGRLMTDGFALLGLNAACTVAAGALPEREPAPGVFEGLGILLDALEDAEIWPALMVRWELGLLESLGFGLDLSRCAVTGTADDLTHVSPRTGRAVSREAALPYRDKLLPLPPFLLSRQMVARPGDVADGLQLTGYFLTRLVFHPRDLPLPDARRRIVDRLMVDRVPEAERSGP
ncbi:MAG: DNA repair protein RecO [Alphaproteobacteria bacterium]